MENVNVKGEVGVATAGLTVKQRWRAVAFIRENANDKHNPNRKVYVPIPGAPSLKKFARELARTGDQVAQDWLDHKRGSMNQERSDVNIKRATEMALATKNAKRKKKGDQK